MDLAQALEVIAANVSGNHVSHGTIQTTAQWRAEGQPYCWEIVESRDGLYVLTDSGHGYLCALQETADGPIFRGFGRRNILCEDFVVLDRDYYDTVKYLWK